MKTVLSLTLILLALAAGTACSSSSQTQDANANYESILSSKNYTFIAQSVTPMGGRNRQLTSEYDLRVLGDSVVSYLPYFGRAYTAPIDPSQGGIQFTSTVFEYEHVPRSNGGWIITIKPSDAKDVRQLTLTVTEKGYGTLQVISNSRQSISYNGYVQARKS